MSFVYPFFLYGLFALVIPILIHLFNFRRYRKVWFTNVRYLAEIKQETQKRSKIKQWILLAIRLLAITSLVIAFAQPYIPSPKQLRKQASYQVVSIYIDNSFSMDAFGKEGKLIDVAKAKAAEIAAAYDPSDRFQILTNDFEGSHQHVVSREEFLQLIRDVKISPAFRTISDVFSRQQDLLGEIPDVNRNIYLISDFQESNSDFENILPDTTLSLFILPLEANATSNLYIDTAYFEAAVQQPDQISRLHVRIRNTGPDKLEKIPVKLVINDRQKAIASAGINPGAEAELIFPFTNNLNGIQSGYLELQDFPIIYDDRCYLSYSLVSSISILCINNDKENRYLNALFQNDSAFHFENTNATRLNYASFNNFSLIILNQLPTISSGLIQELKRFIISGGSLLVFPPAILKPAGYARLLQDAGLPELGNQDTSRLRVTQIRTGSEVYRDVFEPSASGQIELPENADMPITTLHYPIQPATGSMLEPLILLQNGDILLAYSPVEKGKVYFFSSPLEMEYTNFPGHLLFVPTLFKIALLSQPHSPLYYFTADDKPVEISFDSLHQDIIYRIRNAESGFEIIPEMRFAGGRMLLFPHDQIREAGLYTLYRGATPVTGLAYNYPREESELNYTDLEEIKEIFERKQIQTVTYLNETEPSLTREIRDFEKGRPLWKLFIILTLFFLLAEIAVIQLFRRN